MQFIKRGLIVITLVSYCSLGFAEAYRLPSLSYRLNSSGREVEAPSRYRTLFNKSVILAFYQLALIYGLTKVPTSWTNWEEQHIRFRRWGRNWVDNFGREPVWDTDPGWVNYIGHPYSGAAYYTMARQTDFSPQASFIYTFIESSFVWEYGVEALVEEPSIEDLIITPIWGTLIGEANYRFYQHIEANGGRLRGSLALGRFAKVMLSPFNALVNWTQGNLRRFGYEKASVQANFSYSSGQKMRYTPTGNNYFFNIHMKF